MPRETPCLIEDGIKNGRIGIYESELVLVVEYKGFVIDTTIDTKEKTDIGKLWEKKSFGMGLFIMHRNGMLNYLSSYQ